MFSWTGNSDTISAGRPLRPIQGPPEASGAKPCCGEKEDMVDKITVQQRDDKRWEGRRDGAARPSTVADTQSAAAQRSSEILARGDGGEVAIRGRNGQIREQNTVPPGSDPRRSKG